MTTAIDHQVLALCDEVWKWRLKESPELATFCGFYLNEDSWDDISSEAYARREKCVKNFLDQALVLNVSTCSPDVALSYKLLVEDMMMFLKGCAFQCHLMPINYLEGAHIDCLRTLSFMKFKTKEDFANYMQRLKTLPFKIQQTIELLKEGVKEGVTMFSTPMQNVPQQIHLMIDPSSVDESGLLKPFKKEYPGIPNDTLSKLRQEAKDAILSGIFPALANLRDYLKQEYFQALRPQESICCLKNGQAWYQQCLDYHLTCKMTPQQVHDIGLSEVARIHARILQLAEIEGLGQTSPEIFKSLTQRQYDFFKSEEDMLTFVKDLCYNKIRPKLASHFKNLPDVSLRIEKVPAEVNDGPAGYYFNGTADGSRQGCFYINTSNFQTRLSCTLTALCLHEGEPGHHLQDVYLLSASHLPDFRRYFENGKYYMMPRKFLTNSAYYEGWGLYSESLGEELDLYTTNLDWIGRYAYEMHRASRLVVDTGIHAFGWSRARAVQYFMDYCLLKEDVVCFEIDRYINWPGQACSYKIGEMKIWELRRKAEKELGLKFDIKEFHHCILSCGAVPLDVLEEIVDQFIQDVKTASDQEL